MRLRLHLPGSDQYTFWNTTAAANVVSNATGGIVSGTSNAAWQWLEASFPSQDLNGDGVIVIGAGSNHGTHRSLFPAPIKFGAHGHGSGRSRGELHAARSAGSLRLET